MRLVSAALAFSVCGAVCSVASAQETPGFHFGSYGRIRAASDLRGGGPQWGNIVAHGSRLDLSPYMELELRNTMYPEENNKDLRVRVVTTLAFAGDPFHYTGKFETQTAVRNMFVDVRGVGSPNLGLWMGARMYRGDDLYLLDFWPLDNLNTVGGGGSYDAGDHSVQLHVGTYRLLDSAFYYQQRALPSRAGFGAETIATMDRPKTVASAKWTYFLNGRNAPRGAKVSLYGEGHYIASGTSESSTTQVQPEQKLPSDTGFVLGAQGTAYGFGDNAGHVHLFARYARGIAAYGDLSTPTGLDQDRKTNNASEFLVAAGGNYQMGRVGVMGAAYARRFQDASGAQYSFNRYWEGIVAVRPQVYTSPRTGLAGEVSYQFKNANILDADGKHRVPQVTRLSIMPFVTPMGWGAYRRPILYALYTATFRNDATRLRYPAEDPRASRSVEHYLGMQAEWWFDSSSYP